MLGLAAGATGMSGCQLWNVPDDLVALAARGPGLESEVQTVCGMCESGCGMTVRLVDGLPVGLKGNLHHPLNRGGLCPVGHAGLDLLYYTERIVTPLRRNPSGQLAPTTWDAALEEIADRLIALVESGRGDRFAMLSGEDGTLFHDLAGQFASVLGSPHLARPGRPDHLAYEATQGLNEPPGYDLARCDLLLSFGLDVYESGSVPLHAIAAMVGSRPTEERARILYVGTRMSPSADKADQRVPIQPGTHAAFALGVANVLVREGRFDRDFVAEHTHGFDDWTDQSGRRHRGFRRLLMEEYYPDRAAQLCGCEPEQIILAARRFADASAPLAMAGEEATRGSNGTWTAMAIHALNALVGAFDRPGGVMLPPAVPFTPLPTPTTSDVGESLFEAPAAGALGADPLEALCTAVLDRDAEIELLLIADSNPVFDSTEGPRLRDTLEHIPLVVALAQVHDETTAVADIVLPTPTFLERWQATTTPATVPFSTLGIAGPVVAPLHDSRHPGDVLLELCRRANLRDASETLPWRDWSEYVRDRIDGVIASGQGAIVTGSFEESWIHYLEERGWRFQERRGRDVTWTELTRQAGWWDPVQPGNEWGRLFRTPSGRFEFHSSTLEARLRALGAADGQVSATSEDALRRGIQAIGLQEDDDTVCLPHFTPPQQAGEGELTLVPYRPITARGDHGTCSRMVLEMFGYPMLAGWETSAEMSSETARELDLRDGDRIALETDRGSMEAVVRLGRACSPGAVFVPVGLGHEGPGPRDGIGANPHALLAAVDDPLSGLRSLTGTRVHVRLVRRRAHGEPSPIQLGAVS